MDQPGSGIRLRIALYCPDRHLVYDGATPDRIGVGGGVTVRVRLAAAFARAGHQVAVICNCAEPGIFDRVHYIPLTQARLIDADVLLLHTSGGLDLSPLRQVDLRVRLRVLMLSGAGEPTAWAAFHPESLIAPSNFVLEAARASWKTLPPELFVSPHGIDRIHLDRSRAPVPRRATSLIYTSHPCKGLDAGIAILRLLRRAHPDFELAVYGGNRLWGGEDQPVDEPGVTYHGLRPQSEAVAAYPRFGFALHLQRREEPFGLSLIEAMAGGAIPIASPAGAYRELVIDGWNGFLVPGDPEEHQTQQRAADLILAVAGNPQWASYVRQHAASFPLEWDRIAAAWAAYWEMLLTGRPGGIALPACPHCRGPRFVLADGYHCRACGRYYRSLELPVSDAL